MSHFADKMCLLVEYAVKPVSLESKTHRICLGFRWLICICSLQSLPWPGGSFSIPQTYLSRTRPKAVPAGRGGMSTVSGTRITKQGKKWLWEPLVPMSWLPTCLGILLRMSSSPHVSRPYPSVRNSPNASSSCDLNSRFCNRIPHFCVVPALFTPK